MESGNFVAVIAILAEMARCLNKNIHHVHLQPIDFSFTGEKALDLLRHVDQVSNA